METRRSISSYILSLYLEPLIKLIDESGYGYHIWNTPTNIFAYADLLASDKLIVCSFNSYELNNVLNFFCFFNLIFKNTFFLVYYNNIVKIF